MLPLTNVVAPMSDNMAPNKAVKSHLPFSLVDIIPTAIEKTTATPK